MNLKPILFFLGLAILSSCAPEQPKTTQEKVQESTIEEAVKTEVVPEEKAPVPEDVITEATKVEEVQAKLTVSPEQLEKAKAIISAVDAKAIKAVDAKKKYKMICATCHGFTGNMNVNGAKDLTKSKISLEESVAQIYFGKGLMTPSKGILDEAEIVAVAKYIEDFRK